MLPLKQMCKDKYVPKFPMSCNLKDPETTPCLDKVTKGSKQGRVVLSWAFGPA